MHIPFRTQKLTLSSVVCLWYSWQLIYTVGNYIAGHYIVEYYTAEKYSSTLKDKPVLKMSKIVTGTRYGSFCSWRLQYCEEIFTAALSEDIQSPFYHFTETYLIISQSWAVPMHIYPKNIHAVLLVHCPTGTLGLVWLTK